MQMSVLNENLGTVRGDLVTAQTQVADLSKLTDELKGEKLGECMDFFVAFIGKQMVSFGTKTSEKRN